MGLRLGSGLDHALGTAEAGPAGVLRLPGLGVGLGLGLGLGLGIGLGLGLRLGLDVGGEAGDLIC